MKRLLLLFCIAALCLPYVVRADTMSSGAFTIREGTLVRGGARGQSASFGLGQSIGQSIIGRSQSSSFQVWSGFQYYATAAPFVLSGTPGTGQISLSWVPPVVYGGASVASYEVGIGTTNGSYVFQPVGTVTSYLQTGLANATTYYLTVKAVSATGIPLSFSNQIVVTTLGAVTPPPSDGGGGGGGGGGGSSGSASVVVSGTAYPGARVSVLLDGRVEAVSTADPGAAFRVTLGSLAPGSYVVSVYAEDSSGRKSTSYSVPLSLTNSVTAEVSNIFLAPTISVSNTVIKQGDPITILGMSAPNAQVNVHVHSFPEFLERVTASVSGAWFKQFDTSVLAIGDHKTFSRAFANDRATEQSAVVKFVVGTTSEVADTSMRSDLNNDGRVNTIDFSILLYWWQKPVTAAIKADINKDMKVDAVDLSIMLYDWTG